MNLKIYQFEKKHENLFYEFQSEGPKGSIKKVVQYHRFEGSHDRVYNLAFGDWRKFQQNINYECFLLKRK